MLFPPFLMKFLARDDWTGMMSKLGVALSGGLLMAGSLLALATWPSLFDLFVPLGLFGYVAAVICFICLVIPPGTPGGFLTEE